VRLEAELDGDRVRFVDFERLDGNTADLDDPND
jgi:hypothetical protein